MSDLTGQTIRGCEIREKIGEGGYGAVYKAHQSTVGREVAVKVILPEHANKPEFAQRFDSEAQLVARLEDPHIVPLYDYWRDENGAFLVMRFLKGGSLRQVLAQQGALSLAQTARLLDQLAEALNTAHQAGVVHRDLKPDNILLDERGNAYLTDFGIAKQVNNNARITGTDVILGTLAYIAPEQIKNEAVTPQTDIYALGMMTYEMITGIHPFAGTPPMMMVMKQLQERVPSLLDQNEDFPDELDEVIQRATAKVPAVRYPDAPAVAADFRVAARLTAGTIRSAQPASTQPSRVQASADKRKLPVTPEQRNRAAMLQNVRNFWIEGVLNNSLHGAALMALGMTQKAGSVTTPWDAVLKTDTLTTTTPLTDANILLTFDKLNGKFLILGDPGGGKSTTLLELARDLLERAEADEQHPIPAVFNLASWGTARKALSVWLTDELTSKYQVPKSVAQTWLQEDALLLLLDGLDEVPVEGREFCVQAINEYRGEHSFVDVVVCSRIADYELMTRKLYLNGAIVLQPLTDAQIDAYLSNLDADMTSVQRILKEDTILREMSRSPLMLSIITLAYRDVTLSSLPHFDSVDARRKHLFDSYVQRMFDWRAQRSGYSTQRTRRHLAWIARQMTRRLQTVFYIEALQPYTLTSEGQRREYGASIWLARLVILSVGWLLAAIASSGLAVLLAMVVAFAFMVILFLGMREYEYAEEIHFFDSLYPTFNRIAVATIVALGAVFTLIFGVAIGLTTVLSLLLIFCLSLEPARSVEREAMPDRILRMVTLNMLKIAGLWGVAGVAAWAIDLGPSGNWAKLLLVAVGWAVMGGFLFGGGDTLLRHFALRFVLWIHRCLPWRLSYFLRHVTSLAFMQQVGGGYIFVHRYLLEYFAGLGE